MNGKDHTLVRVIRSFTFSISKESPMRPLSLCKRLPDSWLWIRTMAHGAVSKQSLVATRVRVGRCSCAALQQFCTTQVAPEQDEGEVQQPFRAQSLESSLRRKLVAPSSHESPSFMHDPVAMKFVNCMMWDGKKSLSQTILKKTFELIKITQLGKLRTSADSAVTTDPLTVFHQAIENCKPVMGTIGVRRGGKLYHVPYPLPVKRQQFLAIKWLIHASRDRKGHGMHNKLAAEILDAYNNQGTVIKKKQDLHRLAEANRAFAHFRW